MIVEQATASRWLADMVGWDAEENSAAPRIRLPNAASKFRLAGRAGRACSGRTLGCPYLGRILCPISCDNAGMYVSLLGPGHCARLRSRLISKSAAPFQRGPSMISSAELWLFFQRCPINAASSQGRKPRASALSLAFGFHGVYIILKVSSYAMHAREGAARTNGRIVYRWTPPGPAASIGRRGGGGRERRRPAVGSKRTGEAPGGAGGGRFVRLDASSAGRLHRPRPRLAVRHGKH